MQRTELSLETKKRLARLLYFIGESEQVIEFNRQNLCRLPSFEPFAAFTVLDKEQKGFITPVDISMFMKTKNTENVSNMACQHLVKFFDATCQNKLLYKNFVQILLPCDQPHLRAEATQRTANYQLNLPFDVERALVQLIRKELQLAQESEMLKQKVCSQYDFNIDKIIKEIDDLGLQFIDSASLKRFFQKCRIYPSDDLLIALVRRLDLNSDARLSKIEFKDGILAQENYTAQSLINFERQIKSQKIVRPQIPKEIPYTASKISNILHGKDTQNERNHLKQQNIYEKAYKQYKQQESYAELITSINKSIEEPKIEQPIIVGVSGQENLINKFNRLVFREMIGLLNKLESDKKHLAKRKDFTIEKTFLLFTGSENLSELDLVLGFNKLGISCNKKDVQLLIRRFNCDRSGRIDFYEFSNMFLPNDASQEQGTSEPMTSETKSMIFGLLSRHIDVENCIEQIRKKAKDFDLREVFDLFDVPGRGFLTVTEIRRHFDSYPNETQTYRLGGNLFTCPEIELLIRRINKDKQTGKITLTEWLQELAV